MRVGCETGNRFSLRSTSKTQEEEEGGGRMRVVIRNLLGKTFPLEVESTDTIAAVKTKVVAAKGALWVPLKDACIIYGGKLLEDPYTLEYYNVKEDSTLDHGLPPKKDDIEMRIFVKTLNCEVILFTMNFNDTVTSLMHKVEEQCGVPVVQQHLAFSGRRLPSDKTLAQSRLYDGCLVVMILSCPGG